MENHFVSIENRKKIIISAVTGVDAFDEEAIIINLEEQKMIVNGKDLHIETLDLEEGKLVGVGEIEEIAYINKKAPTKFLSRLKSRK